MLYFKFNKKTFRGEAPIRKRKKTLWGKFMDKLYRMGRSNPDFDHKIVYVAKWYIEYDNREDYDTSWREIGLDANNKVIVKMPDDNNYGFWLDTNATLQDFKDKFDIEMITEQEFNDLWNSVVYDRDKKIIKKYKKKPQKEHYKALLAFIGSYVIMIFLFSQLHWHL